jgi:hypothetical protein
MSDSAPPDPLAAFQGEMVVLDTQGPLIYIGQLACVTGISLLLVGADVHDSNDSRTSKDLYIVETRDLGVRVNRTQVVVMRAPIASVSLLKDVVD